jgi:hypothetical protein
MSKEIVDNLAEKVLEDVLKEVKETSRYGIDPLTIIIVIGIIVNVIRVIQECNKNNTSSFSKGETANFLTTKIRSNSFLRGSRGFLNKMRMQNIVKKHLNKNQIKTYMNPLIKAMIELGKTVTDEQTSALLEYQNV